MDTKENEIKDLDAEGLMSLARRYYTTRFPNPQRVGCPPPGEIIKVVSGRRAPDQALREHLFECSECFGEYRQALAQCRPAADEVTWRKRLASIGALKLSAAATAMALLVVSSLFFFDGLIRSKPAPEAGQTAASTPSGARAGGAGEATPNQDAAPSVAAVSKESKAMGKAWKSSSIHRSGAETIDVDLDSYQVFRRLLRDGMAAVGEKRSDRDSAKTSGEPDEAPPGEKIISLPSTRANLVLRLPETGAPGKYNISLIDAFGRPLLSTSASSSDGVKLRMTLDLRRVPCKKYRLRLWRKDEAPAFYDVIIGAR